MDINKTVDTVVTGIYWRKNLWNGAATVPAIVKLDKGIISARTAKEEIFSVPIETISARFTVWGTMVVTIQNEHYDFTGVGASISPSFTEEMLKEIDETKDKSYTTLTRIGTGLYGAGVVTGVTAGQTAGAVAMAVGYFSGLNGLKAWRDVFQAAGVLGTKSVKNFKKSAAIIFIAIVVVTLAVTGILTTLL